MKPCKIYRNRDLERVIAFIPEGHVHVRLLLEFNDRIIILQEASINSIIRAYLNVSSHPTKNVYELSLTRVEKRKPGYAEYQHLETTRSEDDIIEYIKEVTELCEVDSG